SIFSLSLGIGSPSVERSGSVVLKLYGGDANRPVSLPQPPISLQLNSVWVLDMRNGSRYHVAANKDSNFRQRTKGSIHEAAYRSEVRPHEHCQRKRKGSNSH